MLTRSLFGIFKKKPATKQAYVLENNEDHLMLVYTTTFGDSGTLAEEVKNSTAWYPIAPAENKGFIPLPAPANLIVVGNDPPRKAWVYVGQVTSVKGGPVSISYNNTRLQVSHTPS